MMFITILALTSIVFASDVSCRMTIDNAVTSIQYGGNELDFTGDSANWRAPKFFSFTPVEGQALEIYGYEYDNTCNGCQCAGLLLECDNGFTSNLEEWSAVGSDSEITATPTSGFGSVCETSSGFSLTGQTSNAVQIWPDGGEKYAWFRTIPVPLGYEEMFTGGCVGAAWDSTSLVFKNPTECYQHVKSEGFTWFTFGTDEGGYNHCAKYRGTCSGGDNMDWLTTYKIPEEIEIEDGKWNFEKFTTDGRMGTLQRFKGIVQAAGHFVLENVSIVNFDDNSENMMFGTLTLFPDAPGVVQRSWNLVMECENDQCATLVPFGQTIDACDIAAIASMANGNVGMMQTGTDWLMSPLNSIFGAGFSANAAQFITYYKASKAYMHDQFVGNAETEENHDLGGGCEVMGDMAAEYLQWATGGDSPKLLDFKGAMDGIIDFLDNSLGQLTFGVDLEISSRILTKEQLLNGELPLEVSAENLHIRIDNGDQCTGNIVCGVLVALGEAFPGQTGHRDSVLGCTLFEFVFQLDREDWRNSDGVDYNCLRHTDFDDLQENILQRAEAIWTTLKNAPGIQKFGQHGYLCFADEHCKEASDVCIMGLCHPKRGYQGNCWADKDCVSGDCLLFQCTDGRDGAMCNTDDDCDSGRCNLVEFKCRARANYGQGCARDNDCASGDCLLFFCTDGRDGAQCNTNDDCNSGRCDLRDLKCKGRAGYGDGCVQDNDCASGDCLLFFCTDGRDGAQCNTNDDCNSGRCDLVGLKCKGRAGHGDGCVQDNDCASGDCLLFMCTDYRDGAHCVNDGDCRASSRCFWGFCKRKEGTNAWCARDADCRNGECGWNFGCN